MKKNKYQLNLDKMKEGLSDDLRPLEVAMLIVMAGLNESFTEEDTYKKMKEYGLYDMNEQEIAVWVNNWIDINKQKLLN